MQAQLHALGDEEPPSNAPIQQSGKGATTGIVRVPEQ
jgi:hypothetical protein